MSYALNMWLVCIAACFAHDCAPSLEHAVPAHLYASIQSPGRQSTAALRFLTEQTEIPAEIERDWLDTHYEAPLHSDQITSLFDDWHPCGGCKDRIRLHLDTLIGPAPTHGQTLLVYLQNELVGAVKLVANEDDYSFLALRTVKSSAGHFALVKGGVYWLSRTFIAEHVVTRANSRPRWDSVRVDHLHVRPAGFLLNKTAFENFRVLDRFLDEDTASVYRHHAIEAMLAGRFEELPLKKYIRDQVWPKILARLTEARQNLVIVNAD